MSTKLLGLNVLVPAVSTAAVVGWGGYQYATSGSGDDITVSSSGRSCVKTIDGNHAGVSEHQRIFMGEIEVDGSKVYAIRVDSRETDPNVPEINTSSVAHGLETYTWGDNFESGAGRYIDLGGGRRKASYQKEKKKHDFLAEQQQFYGECEKWKVEASVLMPPQHIEFKSSKSRG